MLDQLQVFLSNIYYKFKNNPSGRTYDMLPSAPADVRRRHTHAHMLIESCDLW